VIVSNEPEGEPLLIFPEWKPVIPSAARGPRSHGEQVLQVARMVNITAKCKSYCYSRRAPRSLIHLLPLFLPLSLSLSLPFPLSLSLLFSTLGIKHGTGKTARFYISFRGFLLIGFGYYVSWPRTDCLRLADMILTRCPIDRRPCWTPARRVGVFRSCRLGIGNAREPREECIEEQSDPTSARVESCPIGSMGSSSGTLSHGTL